MEIVNVQTNGWNTVCELFEQILGRNERFVLSQIGIFDFSQPFVVHLKDRSHRTLFTMTYIPGVGARSRETIIKIATISGQLILTARASNAAMTVWSPAANDQYLGKIVSGMGCCKADLMASDFNGQLLFELGRNSAGIWGGHPTELSLTANGCTLARIQKFNDGSADAELCVLQSGQLDSTTRALLILSGYVLYFQYFAETLRGRIGGAGYRKSLIRYIYIFGCTSFLLVTLVLFYFVVLEEH